MVSSGHRVWLGLTFLWFYTPLLLVQAGLHRPRTNLKHTVGKRGALTDSGLVAASWIWASGATTGNVAFLKTFSSSAGKIATSATISFTAVDVATLWVNGQPIGASNDWKSAEVLSAALNASVNTVSILAGNAGNAGAPPPGLLAAIKVQHSDGSADTIVSDSSWQASANIPSDFPTPTDISHFTSAAIAASFGSGAWGTSVALVSLDPDAPTLVGGTWIWSTSDGEYAAPPGTAGFRKNVATPSGKSVQSATILLTADNTFSLYVNGKYIGAPPNEVNSVVESMAWGRAQLFNVGLNGVENVFTVFVTNSLNPTSGATSPAGLVASIRIRYTDGSSDLVGTDPSWLNEPYTSVDAFLSASDSALAPSFNVAAVGAWPWGQLSGISNVLAASDVPSGPFTGIGNIASTTAQGKANAPPRQSAGSNSQSQSAALGTGGSPSGSAAASSAHSGRGVDQSTATGSATNASGTSGSGTAALPFSSSTSASPTHATLVAAIVGAIASTLSLVILGLVIFCWRRRRDPRIVRRQSQGSSIVPFTGEITDTQMAELRPQGLANPALQDRPPTKREREAAAGLTRGPSDDALVSGSATAQSTNGHPSSQERSRSTPEGEGERSTTRGPFSETESTYDTLPPPSYTD